MIHVVIDTNILRSDESSLISPKMQMLLRLVNSGDVKLIIPEIVLKEYISQEEEEFEKNHSKFFDAIKKLQGRGSVRLWNLFIDPFPFGLFRTTPTPEETLNEIKININNIVRQNGIVIYSISNIDINELFDNYFLGKGGFSQKKSRNDFPDAVIYSSIVKILKNVGSLHFISRDGNLQKSVNKIKGVNITSSIKELLDIPLLKEKIEELDRKDKRITSIIEYLASEDCEIKISSYFEKVGIEQLENTFFIENCKKFFYIDDFYPDNISDIKVNYNKNIPEFKYPEFFHLDNKASYLGGDRFSIPVSFDRESTVVFRCTEEQYQNIPYKLRKLLLISHNDEEKVTVSGTLDVEYSGVVIIEKVSEEFTSDELKIHLSYLDTERCSISCRIVIESLLINDSYF